MKYALRAVSRNSTGKVTDIADSWPLNAITLCEAQAEADRQKWHEAEGGTNAFEVTDGSGNALTWRPFRNGGKDAAWS